MEAACGAPTFAAFGESVKAADLLALYQSDGLVQNLAEGIRASHAKPLQLKGLAGSLDTTLLAALQRSLRTVHLVILEDKEQAAAYFSDLQNLVGEKEVFFFPMSYKRPYEYDETENANVLQRAETLNNLSGQAGAQLILTYPEALAEKVITKKALQKNTMVIQVGSTLNREFLEEFLFTYDFEKTDFVYEAGQFAIRGGIIDVFSFAHDLPYRIELFGEEVDSIRSFDPGSQLSVSSTDKINLMPNVQSQLIREERQSLLAFLPESTRVWIKDTEHATDVLQLCFDKASAGFDRIVRDSGARLALEPENLFVTPGEFLREIEEHTVIEFGSRFYFSQARTIELSSSPQPAFNKNFDLLAKSLIDHQLRGYANFIAAEQGRQLDRLRGIFEEIQPDLKFQSLDFPLCRGFVDHNLKIVCFTDHQIFDRYHRYKAKEKFTKSKALTFRELQGLQPGDFVTHIDYGIAKFAGLERKEVNGRQQEAVRLVFRDNDLLYVSIHALHKISRYTGKEGAPPVVSKLGTDEWEHKKARVRKQVKDIARDLISLYAKRKQAPGFAFSPDGFLQAELESSFIYEDTPDQAKATDDVKRDMESAHPMDRLVCGDVGFGKTEVAVRAAFKATSDGKQVAILVPTTILAMQHYRTFSERLANFPVRIAYVSRFKSERDIKQTLHEAQEGTVNILIGTHRVISKDVSFKNLGLLVIDEEQKFGVKAKDRLKELRVSVDVLTLTATPIPRTLHFSLMGARDLSIIATPPPNRQPVTTELHTFNEETIRDAIRVELQRGGQVFFVHNRISDIDSIANTIFKLVPDARIGIAHGQMDGDKLEKVMVGFIEGEYDVLVSTNIIESGLDIPNANTIIINQAQLFGLSDLHQMRGRVGRSNKKAFCYLLTPPTAVLSSDSRKRLAALEEFSDLGDGFKVAMRDLDIRGAGNLLGAEQSGFINDIGFDTYHKILDDAIQELKESEFKELFAEELSEKARQLVPDCVIETDLEILIPESYVSSTRERLQLYAALDDVREEAALQEFMNSLRDRFGAPPPSVMELVNTVRLRWYSEQLGFEKVSLKNGKLRATFVTQDEYFRSAVFGRVLAFVQSRSKQCRLKDQVGKPTLMIEDISNVDAALQLLEPLTR